MFSLNEYISYYLYPRYIDMNKGIECLSELIRSQMNANPLSGDAFLFFGKKKDMGKVLPKIIGQSTSLGYRWIYFISKTIGRRYF